MLPSHFLGSRISKPETPLTLKIPGPHFLLNYRVNANWHECLNGIIVYYLPLRLAVDVYGWYRSDPSPACHQSD